MAVPVTLKVYKGDELIATKEYDRDYIKIGRLSSAHLCLDDEKVSRIHSVIEVAQDGSLSIIDMGSVEGTYVNGKRITKVPISAGDEIRVGNTTIRLADAVAQAAATEPGTDVDTGKVNVAQALQQAAGDALHEDDAPRALDASLASTQQATALGRGAPAPQHDGAADEAPHGDEAAHDPDHAAEHADGSGEHADAGVISSRMRPIRRKGGGKLGLEVRFLWGDQMVGDYFLKADEKRAFTVGSGSGVHFVMGDSRLGAPRFDLIKVDGEGYHLRFTGKMKGELTRRNQTLDLQAVIESGKASHDGDEYTLLLENDDFAWIDLGGVTVELCFQPTPKAVHVPWADSLDFTVINIFLVMFFLASLFVITAMNQELEGDDFADELSSTEARIAKLIIKPPEAQKNPLLEKLAAQKKERESGEIAAKHKGEEGQMGKKDAPKRNAHAAPKGDPSSKDQARMLAQKVFGGRGGGLSTVFGSGGLGGELKSAMGNMFGSAPGDAKGFGGMGLRGTGSGGGGAGETIGIGAIGTKGRGGGTGSYGSGVGVIGGKKSVDVSINASDAIVMGSLDKELIRQVIQRNRGQIRYCYENELTTSPKLAGKVAVKFVISASGSVVQSSVVQSTANNANLESCVAGRVRTWVFPKPKGGGLVVVTYPFIFKQSGE